MKSIRTKDYDLCFDKEQDIVEGKYEIAQCLEIELGSAVGELLFDAAYGRDMEVFHNKPTADDVALEIARVIANERRVRIVQDVSYTEEKASRTATFTFVVAEIETGETIRMEVNANGANEIRVQARDV